MSVEELLSEVRNELQLLRTARKWYERSPWRESIAHGMTLCLATGIALVIHYKTGEPVTLEAKSAPVPREEAAPAAATPRPADIERIKQQLADQQEPAKAEGKPPEKGAKRRAPPAAPAEAAPLP